MSKKILKRKRQSGRPLGLYFLRRQRPASIQRIVETNAKSESGNREYVHLKCLKVSTLFLFFYDKVFIFCMASVAYQSITAKIQRLHSILPTRFQQIFHNFIH